MKTNSLFTLIGLLFLLTAANCSLAANQRNNKLMTSREMRERVFTAQMNERRMIVRLKNGQSISGNLHYISDDAFSVIHTHGVFDTFQGQGQKETIFYSEVAAIEERNLFIKIVKKIGEISAYTTISAAAMPVFIILAVIDSVLPNVDILPDC